MAVILSKTLGNWEETIYYQKNKRLLMQRQESLLLRFQPSLHRKKHDGSLLAGSSVCPKLISFSNLADLSGYINLNPQIPQAYRKSTCSSRTSAMLCAALSQALSKLALITSLKNLIMLSCQYLVIQVIALFWLSTFLKIIKYFPSLLLKHCLLKRLWFNWLYLDDRSSDWQLFSWSTWLVLRLGVCWHIFR